MEIEVIYGDRVDYSCDILLIFFGIFLMRNLSCSEGFDMNFVLICCVKI